MMKLIFDWDNSKNITNFKKHGVWFEEAKTVWADEYAIEFFDEEHSESEDRYIRIGKSSKHKALLIIFCERNENIIRIISARPVTKNEKEQYEEGIWFKEIKEATRYR